MFNYSFVVRKSSHKTLDRTADKRIVQVIIAEEYLDRGNVSALITTHHDKQDNDHSKCSFED